MFPSSTPTHNGPNGPANDRDDSAVCRTSSYFFPTNAKAAVLVLICTSLTVLAFYLSLQNLFLPWLIGQLLLAVALMQWFVLMHEAGHGTLFRTSYLNTAVGHLASVFAIIPFASWKEIHRKHHLWTGWQDKDATTSSLVPRPLAFYEKAILNFCWRGWVPLFAGLYRVQNFWNLFRLRRYVDFSKHGVVFAMNATGLLAILTSLLCWLGPEIALRTLGVAIYLSFIVQESLLLSQHTHIPQQLSACRPVQPFTPKEQEQFTRSLKFPSWISKWVLFHFDWHELHHLYPQRPSYFLERDVPVTANVKDGWRWIVNARRVPAETFLFKNRMQTGLDL